MLVHASCVAIGGRAVLLLGASGAGKSDVALRLIEGGALLVADDQVILERYEGRERSALWASAPPALEGLIEARHLGLLRLPPCKGPVSVVLAVELLSREGAIERLPERAQRLFLDVPVPFLRLFPFEASTPIKIKLALEGRLEDVG